MKIIITISLLFCFASFHAAALELDFTLGAGINAGVANEFVYEDDKCISRLDWKDTAAPIIGFTGNLRYNNAFLRLGTRLAIPVKSGEMENFDYLIANSNEVSHYSRHDAYLDKDFTANAEIGYLFRFKNWYISPSAGFQYRNRKWTASDGYLQYPLLGPWTGEEEKVKLNGSVISYEQAVWHPFGTVELGYIYSSRIEGTYKFGLFWSIYPYIWADTNDTHFLRNVHFYDTFRGGIGWNTGLITETYPKNLNGLGFIFRYVDERLLNLTGSSASNNTGIYTNPLVVDEGFSAKMESHQFHISISIIVPVFR